jgi:hypothetical protein
MSSVAGGALWRSGRPRSRTGRPTARSEQPHEPLRLVEGIDERIRELAAADEPEVWGALTDHGRDAFVGELAIAFAAAPPEDRAPALASVIEAWYRTWLVRQSPDFEEAAIRAGQTADELGEPIYTIDDLKARIGL